MAAVSVSNRMGISQDLDNENLDEITPSTRDLISAPTKCRLDAVKPA
jgi:hypothetical protein